MTPDMYFKYFELLQGPEGCNFRDDPEKTHSFIFDCGAGWDKTRSIRILQGMGLETWEIVNVLIDCHINGGHCDCEIVFNASNHIVREIIEEMLAVWFIFRFFPGHDPDREQTEAERRALDIAPFAFKKPIRKKTESTKKT